MSILNPLEASRNITRSYKDYLLSLNEFADERINSEFSEVLSNGFSLSKGPFIQSTPPYRRSKSVRQLVEEGVLSNKFLNLNQQVLPKDRPLYQHQVEAIEKIAAGRNLIIATGTGSGKTESFLLPVINHLMAEHDAGTLSHDGVRAMLLYPMNALANDQMQRIRDILEPFPEITFGRYIGDTAPKAIDAMKEHKRLFGSEALPNELLSREEMQNRPPHILVTNFAMLEYLLLRPQDTSLFDGDYGNHWKFIVLDEVHTYQGAQGGEISMLLKRVRDRVKKSEKGAIQYVGTSATIGQTNEDLPRLVEFGSSLFDETFEYDVSSHIGDIIRPNFEEEIEVFDAWSATADNIVKLHDSFFGNEKGEKVLLELEGMNGISRSLDNDLQSRLGELLLKESHVQKIKTELSTGAKEIPELSKTVFGNDTSSDEIRRLIDLCVYARVPGEEYSLLSARYHLMLRALEGLFYCFNPLHPVDKARLFLERREECPDCSSENEKVSTFELGPCTQCGATYIIGQKNMTVSGTEEVVIGEQYGRELVYLTEVPKVAGASDDEDEEIIEIVDDNQDVRYLCSICGAISESDSPCSHEPSVVLKVLHSIPKEPDSPLRKCGVCSSRTTGSMVNRVQTGQDAPGAVIATAIYQALPPSVGNRTQGRIGQGRKLLCFSDSRQDAAFFAPYLDRNYSRVVQRRLIMQVLSGRKEPLRFEDLVEPIRREALSCLVLNPSDSNEANSVEVREWLTREVLATDRRLSLSGIGLLNIRPVIPQGVEAPECLTDLGLSSSEAIEILAFLLNTVREQGAVHSPDGVDISDPIFAPRNLITKVRQISEKGVIGWTPKEKHSNRRSAFLDKVFAALGVEADSRRILDELWVSQFTTNSSPWSTVLQATAEYGIQVLRLNWKALEFSIQTDDNPVYVCQLCKQVSWSNIRNVCTATRCLGTLEIATDEKLRKLGYRNLYLTTLPTGMRVEEHTGQLSNEYAAELQQDFVEGKVNVLSCSTTFELGVDLGEIQAVFLRNVPPSPANYVQRAGRAGRRLNSAALVTTFAQRRSHDLYYFASPGELVNGNVRAPQISSSNVQIIRRHVHSVAVAAFARAFTNQGKKWPLYVGEFFRPQETDGQTVAEEFRLWLESRPKLLDEALTRLITDPEIEKELGIRDWSWVDALYEDSPESEKGWLARATEEVLEGFIFVEDLIKVKQDEHQQSEIGSKKRFAIQKTLYSLDLQYNTLYQRLLIEFLAQRVVLPKYGFPVDVVSLDIWRPGEVEGAKIDLTRDLRMGILDFAPSANTVANKKLWVSTGLRRPVDKALREFRWAICQRCNTFRRTPNTDDETVCNVCGDYQKKPGGAIAIRPTFGFLGQASLEKPGEVRPKKVGSISSYFSDFAGTQPELEEVQVGSGLLRVRMGKQGLITVLNRGPRNSGFEVCLQCGFARVTPVLSNKRRKTDEKVESHERPGFNTGKCSSSLKRRFLGHEYLTDTIEIQIPGLMNEEKAWSVLSAVLGATHALGISPRDLEGTIRASGPRGSERALVIFDSVPGGAGYSRRLKEQLDLLFEAAFHLVNNCHCGEETACYGCLKTYSNQGHHEVLSRESALSVFDMLGIN